jgi:hypothetical protein
MADTESSKVVKKWVIGKLQPVAVEENESNVPVNPRRASMNSIVTRRVENNNNESNGVISSATADASNKIIPRRSSLQSHLTPLSEQDKKSLFAASLSNKNAEEDSDHKKKKKKKKDKKDDDEDGDEEKKKKKDKKSKKKKEGGEEGGVGEDDDDDLGEKKKKKKKKSKDMDGDDDDEDEKEKKKKKKSKDKEKDRHHEAKSEAIDRSNDDGMDATGETTKISSSHSDKGRVKYIRTDAGKDENMHEQKKEKETSEQQETKNEQGTFVSDSRIQSYTNPAIARRKEMQKNLSSNAVNRANRFLANAANEKPVSETSTKPAVPAWFERKTTRFVDGTHQCG